MMKYDLEIIIDTTEFEKLLYGKKRFFMTYHKVEEDHHIKVCEYKTERWVHIRATHVRQQTDDAFQIPKNITMYSFERVRHGEA